MGLFDDIVGGIGKVATGVGSALGSVLTNPSVLQAGVGLLGNVLANKQNAALQKQQIKLLTSGTGLSIGGAGFALPGAAAILPSVGAPVPSFTRGFVAPPVSSLGLFDVGAGAGSPLPTIGGGGAMAYPQISGVSYLPGGAIPAGLLSNVGQALGLPGTPLGTALGMTQLPSTTVQGPSGRVSMARVVMVTNPNTGQPVYYVNRGRPLLFSGDLAACRRVQKVASRAHRAVGRRGARRYH